MDKKFFSGANAAKTLAAFAVLGGLFFAGRKAFLDSRRQFPIYPSSGVSRVAHLSEYFGGVKGTAADGEVYVFDSGKPGASVLILGGTHNDEPAGHVAADFHEAPLEYFLINAICYPEKSGKVAMGAEFNLSMEDLDYTMEASPGNLHGFFHREVGDYAGTMPFLMETPNPSQGRFHGKMTNDLIVTGRDENYIKAGKLGRLFVDMDEKGWPLSLMTKVRQSLSDRAEIST